MNLIRSHMYGLVGIIYYIMVCRDDDGESEVEEKNKEERLKQLWDSFKQSTK